MESVTVLDFLLKRTQAGLALFQQIWALRTDIVKMDAGSVTGYNNGGMTANLPADAAPSMLKADHKLIATTMPLS